MSNERSIREIIADIRRQETFANSEEFRQKHPNRETRPAWEQQKHPDWYRENPARVINKYNRER